MKVVLYKMADGVSVGNISWRLVAELMGSGTGWDQQRIDREIAKWVEAQLPLATATAFVNNRATGGLTEDAAIAAIQSVSCPAGCVSSRVIDDSELPAENLDRGPGKSTFRNAWEDTGLAVQVNMPKARLIHMDDIRVVRNAELVKESGSLVRQPPEVEAVFTAERRALLQTLRDIPQTFDLNVYTTPETLKAAWPVELPAK